MSDSPQRTLNQESQTDVGLDNTNNDNHSVLLSPKRPPTAPTKINTNGRRVQSAHPGNYGKEYVKTLHVANMNAASVYGEHASFRSSRRGSTPRTTTATTKQRVIKLAPKPPPPPQQQDSIKLDTSSVSSRTPAGCVLLTPHTTPRLDVRAAAVQALEAQRIRLGDSVVVVRHRRDSKPEYDDVVHAMAHMRRKVLEVEATTGAYRKLFSIFLGYRDRAYVYKLLKSHWRKWNAIFTVQRVAAAFRQRTMLQHVRLTAIFKVRTTMTKRIQRCVRFFLAKLQLQRRKHMLDEYIDNFERNCAIRIQKHGRGLMTRVLIPGIRRSLVQEKILQRKSTRMLQVIYTGWVARERLYQILKTKQMVRAAKLKCLWNVLRGFSDRILLGKKFHYTTRRITGFRKIIQAKKVVAERQERLREWLDVMDSSRVLQGLGRGYITRRYFKYNVMKARKAARDAKRVLFVHFKAYRARCELSAQHAIRHKSAITIQRASRQYLSRKHRRVARETQRHNLIEESKTQAAVEIQRNVRVMSAKNAVRAKQEELPERIKEQLREHVAKAIQTSARGYIAKRRVLTLQAKVRNLLEDTEGDGFKTTAATVIQRNARGMLGRARTQQKRKDLETYLNKQQPQNPQSTPENNKEDKASITIQSAGRMFLSKIRRQQRSNATLVRITQDTNARVIQHLVRSFISKCRLQHRRQRLDLYLDSHHDVRHFSAVTIQKVARSFISKCRLQHRRQRLDSYLDSHHDERHFSAVTIQKVARGHFARMRRKVLERRAKSNLGREAVVCIQCVWRMHRALLCVQKKKSDLQMWLSKDE
eukprot:PhF_6_TR30107/c0_g1_i1/m.43933